MTSFRFVLILTYWFAQYINATRNSNAYRVESKTPFFIDDHQFNNTRSKRDLSNISGHAFRIIDDFLRKGPPIEITSSSKRVRSGQKAKIGWITQKLDHFDESNKDTWEMRYMHNLDNFQPQNPIFIMVGAEWEINEVSITRGHLVDMATEMDAALFYTEHRFYGESKPTEDLSIENLKFVHTKQALADLAHFIRTLKQAKKFKDSKIILASGSYGGTMVAWFRKLYPHLSDGGWASSAPLQAKVDFKEYNEVVGQSIKEVCGSNVYDRIANGIRKLEELFDTDLDSFLKKMNICSRFDKKSKYDMWDLFNIISSSFNGIVQNGPSSQKIIENLCKPLVENGSDDMDIIVDLFLSKMNKGKCVLVDYKNRVEYSSLTKWKYWSGSNSRAWKYQTCTQFGFFQTLSDNQPLGSRVPIDFYLQQCQDIFGITPEQVYENIEKTNIEFGGLDLNASNVYYTNGALDPWSALAKKDNDEQNNVIPGYSHFADFSAIHTLFDSKAMVTSKLEVRKALRKFMGME